MKAINFFIWCIFVPSLMVGIPIGAVCLAMNKEEVKEVIKEVRHGNDTLKVIDFNDSVYILENNIRVTKKYAEIHKTHK